MFELFSCFSSARLDERSSILARTRACPPIWTCDPRSAEKTRFSNLANRGAPASQRVRGMVGCGERADSRLQNYMRATRSWYFPVQINNPATRISSSAMAQSKSDTLKVEDCSKAPEDLETGISDPQINSELAQYLLARHGTIDLVPLPSASPEDPLNWPRWKKNSQVLLVAFHAMITTFMAAGIIPAFPTFAKMYGVSISEASYLTSVQVSIHTLTALPHSLA